MEVIDEGKSNRHVAVTSKLQIFVNPYEQHFSIHSFLCLSSCSSVCPSVHPFCMARLSLNAIFTSNSFIPAMAIGTRYLKIFHATLSGLILVLGS